MTQQGAGWRPGRVRVVRGHPSASPSAGPGGACAVSMQTASCSLFIFIIWFSKR